MRRILLLCIVLMSVLLLSGAVIAQDDIIPDYVAANNTFGINLYKTIAPESDGNLFISPYSINQALSIVYAGAGGETAAEMADVMAITLPQDAIPTAAGALNADLTGRELEHYDGDPMTLNLSNALWLQDGYPFKESYTALIEDNYGAGLNTVDFGADPEAARQTINGWVAEQTEDRIEELIGPGGLSDLTRLVITNTIYFSANWFDEFQPELTADGPFYLTDGSTVTVPYMTRDMMFNTNYINGEDFQAVQIPYRDRDFNMLIIMPDDITTFEADMTPDSYKAIVDAPDFALVELYMPRFEFSSDLNLTDALQSMGMETVFSAQDADLTGIADAGEVLAVDQVIHQAFISVDEQGTEAAAATAVMMGGGGPPDSYVMRLDRPFLFFIYEWRTGTLLFMGRVMNPAE